MEPVWSDSHGALWQGDVRACLAAMEPESVQVVACSPPYHGLRSYSTEPQVWGNHNGCDHDWTDQRILRPNQAGGHSEKQESNKDSWTVEYRDRAAYAHYCVKCSAWKGELGSEPTVEQFIANLVEVFAAVRRVLRDDGTLWVNLGSSYAGSGKGPTGHNGIGDQEARQGFSTSKGARMGSVNGESGHTSGVRPTDGYKAKDLIQTPFLLFHALQRDGWWLRSVAPWIKRSGMPESCTDRPTHSLEWIGLFSKSERYFYDPEALRISSSDKVVKLSHVDATMQRMLAGIAPTELLLESETSEAAGAVPSMRSGTSTRVYCPPDSTSIQEDQPQAERWAETLSETPSEVSSPTPGLYSERNGQGSEATLLGESEGACSPIQDECTTPGGSADTDDVQRNGLAADLGGVSAQMRLLPPNTQAADEGPRNPDFDGRGALPRQHRAGLPDLQLPQERPAPSGVDGVAGHGLASTGNGAQQSAGRNFRNTDFYFLALDAEIAAAEAELRSLRGLRAQGGVRLGDDGLPLAFDVNPQGFEGAHFATWPPKLVQPMIALSTSERGACAACGAPHKRVTERSNPTKLEVGGKLASLVAAGSRQDGNLRMGDPTSTTTGWTPTCDHPDADVVPCKVLDIFNGSGTSMVVARALGRYAVGVELNESYVEMALKRLRQAVLF